MPGIIVYLPQASGADRKELVDRGLGSLLDSSVDVIPTEVRTGPDGGYGKLVTFTDDTPREYNAETQTWLEAPKDGQLERGRYWVGYANTARPSAGDLQRATLYDGEPVRLKDGNSWIVPIADFLPKRLTRDTATGEEVEVPADEHREFVNEANAILDLLMSSGFLQMVERELVIRIPRGLSFAGKALAKNYRVNSDVIDLLKLVDGFEAVDIARAACGHMRLERVLAQKKSLEQALQAAGPS
jgi:hypothetical protein